MTSLENRKIQEQGIASAKALLDALTREYEALAHNDLDALVALLPEKQQALSQLLLIEAHVEKQGITTLKDGVAGAADERAKGPLWNEFSRLMNQCRHQNAVNGRIIHMRQHSTDSALAILRGQENPQQTAYSASGKAIASSTQTRIATA